jgi:hypothetical protein
VDVGGCADEEEDSEEKGLEVEDCCLDMLLVCGYFGVVGRGMMGRRREGRGNTILDGWGGLRD